MERKALTGAETRAGNKTKAPNCNPSCLLLSSIIRYKKCFNTILCFLLDDVRHAGAGGRGQRGHGGHAGQHAEVQDLFMYLSLYLSIYLYLSINILRGHSDMQDNTLRYKIFLSKYVIIYL